jgi:hypothetical protein
MPAATCSASVVAGSAPWYPDEAHTSPPDVMIWVYMEELPNWSEYSGTLPGRISCRSTWCATVVAWLLSWDSTWLRRSVRTTR